MDILLEWLKILGIVFGLLIIFSVIIFGIIVIKNIIKSILVINNIESLLLEYHNENKDQNYIWFEYMNDSGLGKLYNKGTDEEPDMYVLCIYKNNSIQHLPLSKIDKYIPLKFQTFNSEEEKIILKYNNKNE